jgi:hypothetical protein
MDKLDAVEAAKIADTVLKALMAQSSIRGSQGSQLRSAVSLFRLNAQSILISDSAGSYLENIFRLAQSNGILLPEMDYIRGIAAAQNAVLPGAILIRDSLVQYALVTEGLIIAGMTFVSRDDVEAARTLIYAGFVPMEEQIADSIDPSGYMVLIQCRAAIYHHLTVTAMPLPRILNFAFAEPLTTLVAAYRLYADAARADELRDENHVVHPGFVLPTGRALSR